MTKIEVGFEFRQNPVNRKWVIIAPRRSLRPNIEGGLEPACPFCPGRESWTPKEVFRIGHDGKEDSHWEIRVVPNKFPFAPIHEIITHSPDHDSSLFTYNHEQIKRIFRVYKMRFCEYEKKGQVYIFHNHGPGAAESLPHDHTQLAVIPPNITLDIPIMGEVENQFKDSRHFILSCPNTSEWPYEVWIIPKNRGRTYGEITEEEIDNLAAVYQETLVKMQNFFGVDFSFNHYIYPGGDWYLRLIPRVKVPGGFELGTGVFVNTVDPKTAAKQLSE